MISADLIAKEFEQLIAHGQTMLTSTGWDGRNMQRWPSIDEYLFVRTRASNLVGRVCGEKSDHYRELEGIAGEGLANPYRLPNIVGILRAAQADFASGLLFNLRALIEAEILDDFLSQAEALFSGGYHVAAASLAGAVLEDTLRKISDAAKIARPENTKIDSLNVELAKAGIYDKLSQKQITAYADIRNNADHGHFDKVRGADVAEMIKWVQRFASEHLHQSSS
jgi:hypothetical protein